LYRVTAKDGQTTDVATLQAAVTLVRQVGGHYEIVKS
jgi:hypothetical protein